MQDDSTPSGSTPKKKILVVENEEALRHLLQITLGQAGFEVRTAENGIEGLAQAGSFKPDLIISDLEMPKMGGIQMGQALVDNGERTPIIYISTVREDSPLRSRMKEITPHFLSKPFRREELLAVIAGIFACSV